MTLKERLRQCTNQRNQFPWIPWIQFSVGLMLDEGKNKIYWPLMYHYCRLLIRPSHPLPSTITAHHIFPSSVVYCHNCGRLFVKLNKKWLLKQQQHDLHCSREQCLTQPHIFKTQDLWRAHNVLEKPDCCFKYRQRQHFHSNPNPQELNRSRASNSPPQGSSAKTFTLESAQKAKRNPLQKNKVKALHQCQPTYTVKILICRMLA